MKLGVVFFLFLPIKTSPSGSDHYFPTCLGEFFILKSISEGELQLSFVLRVNITNE